MRAYTLSLLAKLSPDGSPIVESEIVSWANERLAEKDCSIRHFKVNIITRISWQIPFSIIQIK